MIGMPSRLTAPLKERQKRQLILQNKLIKEGVKGYAGVRINKLGETFLIQNAFIWTIKNEEEKEIGQAATFNTWEKI